MKKCYDANGEELRFGTVCKNSYQPDGPEYVGKFGAGYNLYRFCFVDNDPNYGTGDLAFFVDNRGYKQVFTIDDDRVACMVCYKEVSYDNMGDRIKGLLDERGLTQAYLAGMANISTVSICRYIRNERIPTLETLKIIAQSLDTTTDYLLGLSDEK